MYIKIVSYSLSILFMCLVPLQSSCAFISSAQAYSCAIQNDGAILAVGQAASNDVNQIALARFLTTGLLDTSFGASGITLSQVGKSAGAQAITLQSDGKALVSGFATVEGITQLMAARYTTVGSLDVTFGSSGASVSVPNGVVVLPVGDGAVLYAVALQADNKIVVAGVTVEKGTPSCLVARYDADGSLDTAFNSGGAIPGIVITPIGVRCQISSVAIQADDQKIVAVGLAVIDGKNQWVVVRYNPDGSADTSFGPKGDSVVLTPIGSTAQAQSITIQQDGALVVAGSSDSAITLARYNKSDGSLDTTFNGGGKTPGIVITQIGNKSQANAVAIQADGKIVITGFSDTQLLVAQYNSDGSLDTTFGAQAKGYITVAQDVSNVGNSIALQQDGKIIVAGATNDNFLLVCLNSDGSFNTNFGTNGVAIAVGPAPLIGPTGPAGATGVTGTTGATGADATNFTSANYVCSYSTTTQVVSGANTFTDITLNTDAKLNGWGRSAGTFTCNQTGTYQISYRALADDTASAGSTMSFIAIKNGTEIVASQASITFGAIATQRFPATNSFIESFTAGDNLKFQMAGTVITSQITAGNGSGTTKASFEVTIIRIA